MDTLGIILGAAIVVNIFVNIALHNWSAVCGWLVAGLEWSRRFITA